ncbi:Mg2+ and Co2+ transporter [Candidatus Scalindua japonica]|uniref:Mg2+ and Co2+ transporter n=1 Tax=Candidatus Scalindua japonica TaxID=1284222 RepID=A0A286TW61_9BACT|nr:hypothetical protein [Candidatus Scalindua japonica]GAX60126.1 Mg2+ and Co2+ transporter [Candidatus Scalindua japonica]
MQELQIEYDKELRKERIVHYKELWKELKPLAKYPEPEPLTHDNVKSLAVSLKDWYFTGGGLFLSAGTRERYFDLQDGFKILLQKQAKNWPFDSQKPPLVTLKDYLERPQDWICPDTLLQIAESILDPMCKTIPIKNVAHLQKLGSSLRTSITDDVLTRQDTVLRKSGNERNSKTDINSNIKC